MTDRHAWAEPGPEQVADDVFRIPLPLPGDALRAVNVYAIRDRSGVALVDAGWDTPASWAALDCGLRRLGAGIGAVRVVAATHLHNDHIGQAARLRDDAGAAILLGAGERPSLEQIRRDEDHGRGRVARRLRRLGAAELAARLEAGLAGGTEPPDRARYELPDVYLAEGSAVVAGGRPLAVVPTPGHTQGHVCLWDEGRRLLYAGDHVLPHITPSIGLEPVPARRPLADFLRSLGRVQDLPAAAVLPAHGPVFGDLRGRVLELLEHHERRLRQCRAALEQAAAAPGTAVDAALVAGRLRWTRREHRLQDLDGFNQMLAVGETAAHLDVLVDRGEAVQVEQDGVLRYRPGIPPSPDRTPAAATAPRSAATAPTEPFP